MVHRSMGRVPDEYCDSTIVLSDFVQIGQQLQQERKESEKRITVLHAACQASVGFKINRLLIAVTGRGSNKMSIARWRADTVKTPHVWIG
jgi:hypothetical protein